MLVWLINALLLVAGATWAIWAARQAARASTTAQRPPLVAGLPLLGSTIALARDGVSYIAAMRAGGRMRVCRAAACARPRTRAHAGSLRRAWSREVGRRVMTPVSVLRARSAWGRI